MGRVLNHGRKRLFALSNEIFTSVSIRSSIYQDISNETWMTYEKYSCMNAADMNHT